MKKILAMVLALCMVFSMVVPAMAKAADPYSQKTAQDAQEAVAGRGIVEGFSFHCNDIEGRNGRTYVNQFRGIDLRGRVNDINTNKHWIALERMGTSTAWKPVIPAGHDWICVDCGRTDWVTFSNNSGIPNGKNIQLQHLGPSRRWITVTVDYILTVSECEGVCNFIECEQCECEACDEDGCAFECGWEAHECFGGCLPCDCAKLGTTQSEYNSGRQLITFPGNPVGLPAKGYDFKFTVDDPVFTFTNGVEGTLVPGQKTDISGELFKSEAFKFDYTGEGDCACDCGCDGFSCVPCDCKECVCICVQCPPITVSRKDINNTEGNRYNWASAGIPEAGYGNQSLGSYGFIQFTESSFDRVESFVVVFRQGGTEHARATFTMDDGEIVVVTTRKDVKTTGLLVEFTNPVNYGNGMWLEEINPIGGKWCNCVCKCCDCGKDCFA